MDPLVAFDVFIKLVLNGIVPLGLGIGMFIHRDKIAEGLREHAIGYKLIHEKIAMALFQIVCVVFVLWGAKTIVLFVKDLMTK